MYNFNRQASFSIKHLTLIPMAKVGQQHRRSLTTHVTGTNSKDIEKAVKLLEKRLHQPLELRETSTEKVAALLNYFASIQLEATPVKIPLVSGKSWDDEITSFVLEVECVHANIPVDAKYYVAGYLDRPLLTVDGAIDERSEERRVGKECPV